jgi:DNA repair protein RadA/Sms
MTDMLIPRGNLKGFDTSKLTIKLHQVGKVEEAFRALFA